MIKMQSTSWVLLWFLRLTTRLRNVIALSGARQLTVLGAFLTVSLVSCGNPQVAQPQASVLQPISPQENIAASLNAARAIVSSRQNGFPHTNLNDGTPATIWGAAEGQGDTYAGVVLPAPGEVHELRITVFSPPAGQHLRDISVVAADSEGTTGPDWHVVKSRLAGGSAFSAKLTVPPFSDGTVVSLEVDRTDPNWKPHKIWGFACLSQSQGYMRNYVKTGTGVYVRELQMK